jgi:hypothetical protein
MFRLRHTRQQICKPPKKLTMPVKRLTRPLLGFKSFWAARCAIAGIEVMHAIRKGQVITSRHLLQTPAEQFYALAA